MNIPVLYKPRPSIWTRMVSYLRPDGRLLQCRVISPYHPDGEHITISHFLDRAAFFDAKKGNIKHG